VRKPEGKSTLGRMRSRWEDGIRMHLREIGWRVWSGFMCVRIETGGGPFLNAVMNFGFWRRRVS
jgi:hypothetical protein